MNSRAHLDGAGNSTAFADWDDEQRVCDPSTIAQLQHELELKNWALNAASSHFMITDMASAGWPIVFVNRALAHAHGYEPGELIGKSASLLVSSETDSMVVKSIASAMHAGAALRTELRAHRKDGSSFWVGISLTPMCDGEGRVTHYVSVGADITARREETEKQKALQRQLYEEMQGRERMAIELRLAQKLESVGRLAAGIAHEINTPIQYIGDSVRFLQSALTDLDSLLGLYRTLLADLPPGAIPTDRLERIRQTESAADLDFLSVETPKAFERTMDGVARVAAIVRAMKEFAHPDVNEQALADINHAIETTLTVARSEYKYHATIQTCYAELPEILCNAGELNQVFLNLIVNAAHAIEQSGQDATAGRIRIRTVSEGERIAIEIADNGCGIPAAHLDKIFDPFFTTKEVGRGTGQGLAIARAIIVDKHRGSIDVESTVGSGSLFRIRLPVGGRGAVA